MVFAVGVSCCGRELRRPTLKAYAYARMPEHKLEGAELENDHELQDIILSTHHASAQTITNTPVIKITENQNGQACVSRCAKPPK